MFVQLNLNLHEKQESLFHSMRVLKGLKSMGMSDLYISLLPKSFLMRLIIVSIR